MGRRSSLEPGAPLLVTDRIGVLDPGPLARVEREAAVLVLEAEPQLLEGVAVVADTPRHRVLAFVACLEAEFVPREWVLAVEQVGPVRVTGVPVN